MPRYFFHLLNDLNATDEEGQDLPSLEAAQAQARSYALDMAAQSISEHAKIDLNHRIDVADVSGGILFTARFGDVVKVVS